MKNDKWLLAMAVLIVASLACRTLTGERNAPATEFPAPSSGGDGDSGIPSLPGGSGGDDSGNPSPDSELFPMPSDAENVITMGDETVIFQTKMSLDEAMNFYRDAYGKQGYSERGLLTITSDTTFSMVFDGHSSGKAIVVQGVDLGDGSINITISLQDV